jgi:uncharacterized membrane protein
MEEPEQLVGFPLGVVLLQQDSRTWVPKSIPWMGWTLNIAKPAGAYWLVFFLAGLPTLMLGILILIIEASS